MSTARLSMPHDTSTKWAVITGPPGSGKTTLVASLAAQGFPVVPDYARMLIEELAAQGVPQTAARRDELLFQAQVLNGMLRQCEFLSPNELTFFDYALPDNVAYLRAAGLPPPQPVREAASRFRYKWVFYLEPVPWRDDPTRLESPNERVRLGREIRIAYEELGYALHILPGSSVEDRLNRVLMALTSSGAI